MTTNEKNGYACTHHFKPKRAVNHEQHKICNFTDVNHAVEVIVAFDKRQTPLLASNDCDGTLDIV